MNTVAFKAIKAIVTDFDWGEFTADCISNYYHSYLTLIIIKFSYRERSRNSNIITEIIVNDYLNV